MEDICSKIVIHKWSFKKKLWKAVLSSYAAFSAAVNSKSWPGYCNIWSLWSKSLENFPSHEAEAEAQIQVEALNMEPTFKRGAKENFLNQILQCMENWENH